MHPEVPDVEDVCALSDRELLLAGRAAIVAANRAFARQLVVLAGFYRRREATYRKRVVAEPHFTLTARQETVVEVGELWGLSEPFLRRRLNDALFLLDHLPQVWALVGAGQVDEHKTTLVVQAARQSFDHADTGRIAEYDRLLASFLTRKLKGVDDVDGDDGAALVCCTSRQLRNRIAYAKTKLRPADAEAEFRRRYADRHVSTSTEDGTGMGWLGIHTSADRIQVAQRRLTLNAKQLRAAGDSRTLDQLRADLAIDLLAGTKTLDEHGNVLTVPPPTFARPVVNVTVPIQTLMGIADLPGTLGGHVIPAGLARAIAAQPGSTWYRMLTDPINGTEGKMVELSTKSYAPAGPVWRAVVAEHGTCFRPGCDKPAAECELDHRDPWPAGATSTVNLWPGCKADHKAKHAPGFGIQPAEAGSWVLTTPAGFRHAIPPVLHPTSTGFPDIPVGADDFQFSVTELADAIGWLRHLDERRLDPIGLWEDDPDHEGLDELPTLRAAIAESAGRD